MKFGDVEVTTRARGACLQGSRVRIEKGVLHLWRVSDSEGQGQVSKRPTVKVKNHLENYMITDALVKKINVE